MKSFDSQLDWLYVKKKTLIFLCTKNLYSVDRKFIISESLGISKYLSLVM